MQNNFEPQSACCADESIVCALCWCRPLWWLRSAVTGMKRGSWSRRWAATLSLILECLWLWIFLFLTQLHHHLSTHREYSEFQQETTRIENHESLVYIQDFASCTWDHHLSNLNLLKVLSCRLVSMWRLVFSSVKFWGNNCEESDNLEIEEMIREAFKEKKNCKILKLFKISFQPKLSVDRDKNYLSEEV